MSEDEAPGPMAIPDEPCWVAMAPIGGAWGATIRCACGRKPPASFRREFADCEIRRVTMAEGRALMEQYQAARAAAAVEDGARAEREIWAQISSPMSGAAPDRFDAGRFEVWLPADLLAKVDEFRRAQPDLPSRGQAVRRILDAVLRPAPEAPVPGAPFEALLREYAITPSPISPSGPP